MINSDYIYSFADIITKQIAPGYNSKIIHTDTNTFNFIEVRAGNTVPTHHHFNEQCAFVLEGEFELVIDGQSQLLTPGLFAIIPHHVPHSGRAVTDCRLLDIFTPVREEFKKL